MWFKRLLGLTKQIILSLFQSLFAYEIEEKNSKPSKFLDPYMKLGSTLL